MLYSLLNIANNDLPAFENKYKKLQRNVNELESKELDASITLEDLKSQIQNADQMLDSYHLSCEKEVRKMFQLHRQNIILNALLRQFKNNDENYLKIRYAAKQAVESVLSDSRQLLKFAVLSLIESLHADPIKFNYLAHVMPSPLTMSKPTMIEHAGISSNYCVKSSSSYYNQNRYAETLTEVIADEAANLYEKVVKDFTNEALTNAVEVSSTKLLPSMIYSNEHTDHKQAPLTYRRSKVKFQFKI